MSPQCVVVLFLFQEGNWVASCILQFETVEKRAEIIEQFISIAQVSPIINLA